MSFDAELLLLSWTQLQNALLLTPNDPVYSEALQLVAARLEEQCDMTGMQLIARSYGDYTVSYACKGEQQLHTFPAAEVEEFA